MPPAPLGARLCRMPAPCLTGRNGVFAEPRDDGALSGFRTFPQKNAAFSSEAGRRAEHVRGPKASVPPRTDLTPSHHGAPPSPTISHRRIHRRAFFPHALPPPVPRASRAALPPTLHASATRSPALRLPFLPPVSRFGGHFPALLPGAPPPPRRAPRCLARLQQPKISAPATRPRSPRSRITLSLFLLAPSFTRPAKHAASRLSDSAFGFPAARRPPSSGVST